MPKPFVSCAALWQLLNSFFDTQALATLAEQARNTSSDVVGVKAHPHALDRVLQRLVAHEDFQLLCEQPLLVRVAGACDEQSALLSVDLLLQGLDAQAVPLQVARVHDHMRSVSLWPPGTI